MAGKAASNSKVDETKDRRLPPLLRRAWYGLNQAFRRRVMHLEITPDQYTVLRNLCEAGSTGMTQSELTQRMASDPNTIASLVERMELAGLLHRRPDPRDRRMRRLRVSLLGRKKFRAALEVALALQQEVMSVLDDGEREQFLEILAKLADACRRAADRG
jgi:DNA-binding MarR family transcriptional regulator